MNVWSQLAAFVCGGGRTVGIEVGGRNSMGRWRIGVAFRVLTALLLIVVLAAGLGGFTLHTFRALHGRVSELAERRLPDHSGRSQA